MVSSEQAAKYQAQEVARQQAPDRRCGRVIHVSNGVPVTCPQIVKLGAICPCCGVRVKAEG